MRKAIAVLGAGLVVAGAGSSALAESGDYTVAVPLAAVSPVGDFPIHVETPEFIVDGTIHVELDAQARLTAHADFPGRTIAMTGRFAAAGGREQISLRTAGRGAARFSGKLVGTTFTGAFVDGGALTKGVGSFAIDVSSSGPLVATISASVQGGSGATRHGTGSATVGGGSQALVVDVPTRAFPALRARAPRVQFDGTGLIAPGTFRFASWRARGFGATASGATLEATYDPVPDVTMLLVNGDPHESAGGTPVDLSLNAGPLLAHMLTVRGLEVVTTTFANNDESAPNPGYSGMVAKLSTVRDTSIATRTFPTRIVVVAFGQGAVRAHAAIRDVPDAPIAALIDLDATSVGWSFQGHDTDAIGGDPVGLVSILGEPFNLEQVVFDNVALSFEVHSAATVPDSLTGGGDAVPFDGRTHRRLDGGVSGLFRLDTQTGHEGLVDVYGTALPTIGRWLVNEIAPSTKRK
jgi:hypothetical protein